MSMPSPVLKADSTFFSVSKAGMSVSRPPHVQSVTPQLAHLGTAVDLVLSGSQFGLTADDLRGVFLGVHECTDVKWLSPTSITCVSPVLDPHELGYTDRSPSGPFCVVLLVLNGCIGFLSVDIVVQTAAGGFGSSFPRFLFVHGNYRQRCSSNGAGGGDFKAQFNDAAASAQGKQWAHVRAVGHTLTNQDGLLVAFDVRPNDEACHLADQFTRVQEMQIAAGLPPSRAIAVDDIRKYKKRSSFWLRVSDSVSFSVQRAFDAVLRRFQHQLQLAGHTGATLGLLSFASPSLHCCRFHSRRVSRWPSFEGASHQEASRFPCSPHRDLWYSGRHSARHVWGFMRVHCLAGHRQVLDFVRSKGWNSMLWSGFFQIVLDYAGNLAGANAVSRFHDGCMQRRELLFVTTTSLTSHATSPRA